MSSIKIFKGFTKVFDPALGKSIAKCNSCADTIQQSSLLKKHMLECKGSGLESNQIIIINSIPKSPEPVKDHKKITEAISCFFYSFGITSEAIDHPSAIEMFNRIGPNVKLPTQDELSRQISYIKGIPSTNKLVKQEMPEESTDEENQESLHKYMEDYGLNEVQCEGLFNLLSTRNPGSGYPESSQELSAAGISFATDPLTFCKTDENENDAEGEEVEGEDDGDFWDALITQSPEPDQSETEDALNDPQTDNDESMGPEETSANDDTSYSAGNNQQKRSSYRKLDWTGFAKVGGKRKMAMCNFCGFLVTNSSRMDVHRSRCRPHWGKSGPNPFLNRKPKRNDANQTTEDGRIFQTRRPLDWTGFSKVPHGASQRTVAKCDACGILLMNSSRLIRHRIKCLKWQEMFELNEQDLQAPLYRKLNWDGFTKVYDAVTKRQSARCNACGKAITNTSRMEQHRSKCLGFNPENVFHTVDEIIEEDEDGNKWMSIQPGQSTAEQSSAPPRGEPTICDKCGLVLKTGQNRHRLTCDGSMKSRKRKLNWEGFNKFYDAKTERMVAKCNTCGDIIKNTSRIEDHREKCLNGGKKSTPRFSYTTTDRRTDWRGFSRERDEKTGRLHAKCNACSHIISNTSRMKNHRTKCQLIASAPDDGPAQDVDEEELDP